MLARCPKCDTLQTIDPTGTPIGNRVGFSASYKRVVVHKHPTEPKVCPGSGVLV